MPLSVPAHEKESQSPLFVYRTRRDLTYNKSRSSLVSNVFMLVPRTLTPYLSKMPILSIFGETSELARLFENKFELRAKSVAKSAPATYPALHLCVHRLGRYQDHTYLDSKIEGRLTSECQHDAIRPLFLNHMSDVLRCHWKVVDLVCQLMICLYSSDIGINKDRGDVLLFQCFECLRTYTPAE